MEKIVFFLAIIVVSGDAQISPPSCENPNGKVGICQSIHDCGPMVEILSNANFTERDTEFVRASVCINNTAQYPVCCTDDKEFKPEHALVTRFSGATSPTAIRCPIMERGQTQRFSTGIKECDTEAYAPVPAPVTAPAPSNQSPFVTTRRPVQIIKERAQCVNPNRRRGECTSLNDCKPILGLLNTHPLSADSIRFLKESECPAPGGGIPEYCCTDDTGYLKKSNIFFPPEHVPEYKPSNGVGVVIPQRNACGAHAISDRILGGNETSIGEFPWMALIEYRKDGKRKLSCAGSIINKRYILTAAHCVVSKFTSNVGEPTLVRLGEYNITSEIDCTPDTNDCNWPIVEIGIEKIIPHEHFDSSSRSNTNDIALIRLNQNIPERNPFIEPVCLPSAVGFEKSAVGRNLTVAGWGKIEIGDNAKASNVKLKLTVPISPPDYCTQLYATQQVRISNSQICAGGYANEDSCGGDSGGPLMAFMDTMWVLEGVVSFGYSCGVEGWPGVYTRVQDYEYWIAQNLEP